jgi:general transcription factor 3C polypeptide 3 (transcription factor C subunit 4)
VCHAARDSVVYTEAQNTFLIHLAWATCAVYAGDEETCIAVARYFMRIYAPGSDSYRMFSALCRVCQSPVSWYTSGPAQKFFLRQIKSMDEIYLLESKNKGKGKSNSKGKSNGNETSTEIEDEETGSQQTLGLDVCLLTVYGHVLYSTGSYNYSLSYFARAVSVDPTNALICLSAGLAYIHHALQRQSKNRQYLLMQGFAYLFRYYDLRLHEDDHGGQDGDENAAVASLARRQEAHFNIARAYSLVGLTNLAVPYYNKVLDEARRHRGENGQAGRAVPLVGMLGREDLTLEAAFNIRSISYMMGDLEGAKAVTEEWLVLE